MTQPGQSAPTRPSQGPSRIRSALSLLSRPLAARVSAVSVVRARTLALRVAACLVLCCGLAALPVPTGMPRAGILPTAAQAEMTVGQTVYVPVYSSVVYGNRGRTLNITTMLSVRNTDQRIPITLMEVRYVDENGKTVRTYLNEPRQLPPLGSAQFVVEESDTLGGAGPAFIVVWRAATQVSQPLAQGVMIGTVSSQGISFITEGKVVGNAR